MATTTSQFTAVGVGTKHHVKHGDVLLYTVSNTFVGTWVLERTQDNGISFTQLISGTGTVSSLVHEVVLPDQGSAQYRFQVTAFTSGTVDTSIVDSSPVVSQSSEFKNDLDQVALQLGESKVSVNALGFLDDTGKVIATDSSSGGFDFQDAGRSVATLFDSTGNSIMQFKPQTAATNVAQFSLNSGASEFRIVADTGSSAGAQVRLFGSTHATKANDLELKFGTTDIMAYDHSATMVTMTPNTTFSGSVIRAAQKYMTSAAGLAKAGATAGWVVAATDNVALVTLPASQTASTLVVPVTGLKVGATITSFHLVGQIESAGGTVTVDAALRKMTAAAADVTDASLGAIVQVSAVEDTILSAANSAKTLDTPEVVAADETFYVLITATTDASTDIALQAVAVVVTEA